MDITTKTRRKTNNVLDSLKDHTVSFSNLERLRDSYDTMTLDYTNMEYVMHLNSTGVSALALGNIHTAKENFENALRTSIMEARENLNHHTAHVPVSFSLTPVPIASLRSRRVVNTNLSRTSNSSIEEVAFESSTDFSSYKHAFLINHEAPINVANNQEPVAPSYLAVVMFNMAVTLHHQHINVADEEYPDVQQEARGRENSLLRQRQQRSCKGKAIRFYDATFDLLVQARTEEHDWWWNLLIATLFNKACALCDQSQYGRAQNVVFDLTEIMLRTTNRPPSFQDEDVQELRLQALLCGSLAKHASAA